MLNTRRISRRNVISRASEGGKEGEDVSSAYAAAAAATAAVGLTTDASLCAYFNRPTEPIYTGIVYM